MTTDTDIWKALSDPTRRDLLDALREEPKTTGDLCQRYPGLSRTAVMKHLELLVGAGLVIVRREGRFRWNHLNPVPLQEIYDRWLSPYVKTRAASATRLKRLSEKLEQDKLKG